MQGIKAFVGHSFSEADKEVVRLFTDHFDNLTKAHGGGFTWDHAEEAEALPLSQKVLAKIQGKNVFVGICTRKERAVEQDKLRRMWLSQELKASQGDLVWKTSDWIIQEIGLAVGRGMSVIIFLEDGVRAPGGLYGNTEYISFSRDNPQRSFDKLLQMLVALSPADVSGVIEEIKAPPSDKPEQKPADEDLKEPDTDWTQSDYDDAIFWAIYRDDDQRFGRIDSYFKSSIHAQGTATIVWNAKIERWRLLLGKKTDFDLLKGLAQKNPQIPEVLSAVAFGYETYDEFAKAAENYEAAARAEEDDASKANLLSSAVSQYSKAGNATKVAELVAVLKTMAATNADAKLSLLGGLTMIAEQEKDEAFQIALLEHKVENSPADTDARFSLAYKYSENDNRDMALHHYLKIPIPQRHEATWNNLGVSYGEFQLPFKGVRAFRRSADAGGSLAMSNLGNKLLSAGFLEEAKAECDKALAIPNYDKNIPALLNRLREVPDDENKKLEELLQKIKTKADFFMATGALVVSLTPIKIAERWAAPEGNIEATYVGETLRIFGSYERPLSALAGILSGPLSLTPRATRHKIEFVGRMRGRVFFGKVSRTGEFDTVVSSLLGSGIKTIMQLSDDETEFSVMENYPSQSPEFYKLKAFA